MTAPPAGVLEELDGGLIQPRPAPPPAVAWPRAMAAASVVAASRPRLWAFALLAFLARGGLVVLVLPMLVLPTFVGISNTVGPTSVTAAGPTPRLIGLIATWVGIALAAIVGGTLVGSAAEVALHGATLGPGGGAAGAIASRVTGRGAPAPRRATLRIAAVRLVLLVPVALALAVAIPAWVQVAYRELLLPSDLAVPLPIRVVAGAPVQAALVVATWLAAEVLGGLAARQVALRGSSVGGALGGAVDHVVRAPITTLLILVVALAGTLLVLVPAILVVGMAWDRARVAVVDGTDGIGVIVSVLVLVTAWALCLAVAGIAAAWRSAIWAFELARRARPD